MKTIWILILVYFAINVAFTGVCMSVNKPFKYEQSRSERFWMIVRLLCFGTFFLLFAMFIFVVDLIKGKEQDNE